MWGSAVRFWGESCNMPPVDCSVGIEGFRLKIDFVLLSFAGREIEVHVI